MSFPIACPNCDARLQVPDDLVGKRVKCKKCDEAFVARRSQADNEDDPRPTRTSSKVAKGLPPAANRRKYEDDEDEAPVRKSARASRQLDDDDIDEPRPRPKKRGKKSKKAGTPVLLFVLLGIGALVVLGGGAAAIYFLSGKNPDKLAIGGNSPQMGAFSTEITIWAGSVLIRLPNSPRQETNSIQTPEGAVSTDTLTCEPADGIYIVVAARFPGGKGMNPAMADAALDAAVNAMVNRIPGGRVEHDATILHQEEYKAREVVLAKPDGSRAMARVIICPAGVLNMLVVPKSGKIDQARTRNFFEGLKIR